MHILYYCIHANKRSWLIGSEKKRYKAAPHQPPMLPVASYIYYYINNSSLYTIVIISINVTITLYIVKDSKADK